MWRATASTNAGSQSKSGNPCERLIAPVSAASFDITVKMVVPTLGSLDAKGGTTGSELIFVFPAVSALRRVRSFEHPGLAILAARVPRKMLPVHRNVDTRR